MGEQIISRHEMNKWISGCPLLLKELTLISRDGKLKLRIHACPCTDREISSHTADVYYYNTRREMIGTDNGAELTRDCEIDVKFTEAAYAEATVRSVTYSDGEVWENSAAEEGKTLPEQPVIWQTDPLYKVIKKVTEGKVNAKYYPDTVLGGWRCACGQVNINSSEHCGGCGCSKIWLDDSFSRDYLESQKAAVDEGKKPESAQRIKKREAEKLIPDNVKMILILASILLVIAITLVSVLYIAPLTKYNKARSLASAGEYDNAIEILYDLGGFKDSSALAERYTYEKFTVITGISELYITTTEREPWFEISESGALEFISSKYTGTWDTLRIPHVVNGTVVRELAKNFCINCKELVSVTIPDTVEVIGDQAFLNCELLSSVTFGKSVKTIAQRAFIDCMALEEIIIPDTVESLGQRAFNNCAALKRITLGKGITQIGGYTFSNCTALETVALSSPVTEIGEYAFNNCPALTSFVCAFSEDQWLDPIIDVGNDILSQINTEFLK